MFEKKRSVRVLERGLIEYDWPSAGICHFRSLVIDWLSAMEASLQARENQQDSKSESMISPQPMYFCPSNDFKKL